MGIMKRDLWWSIRLKNNIFQTLFLVHFLQAQKRAIDFISKIKLK